MRGSSGISRSRSIHTPRELSATRDLQRDTRIAPTAHTPSHPSDGKKRDSHTSTESRGRPCPCSFLTFPPNSSNPTHSVSPRKPSRWLCSRRKRPGASATTSSGPSRCVQLPPPRAATPPNGDAMRRFRDFVRSSPGLVVVNLLSYTRDQATDPPISKLSTDHARPHRRSGKGSRHTAGSCQRAPV